MTDTQHDPSRLIDEAIDLVIRLQNDPGNPVAQDMARAWRARGPEHHAAWERVAQVHDATGRILTEKRRRERRDSLGLSRRNLMVGAGLAIGAGGIGYGVAPELALKARADHMTGKAEVRNVTLPDGGAATLGPETAMVVDYGQAARRIELLAGMSYFDAPAGDAPFSVRTASLTAQTTLSAAFDVSNDAGILSASVARGAVEARSDGVPTGRTLRAGGWLIVDPASGGFDSGVREPDQIATWRDKVVVAEKETVAALVARIGRWVPGRIVMADPFIANLRVSGVFDLGHPQRALEAVVYPAGGRLRRISSFLTVVSPV
ncbi:FecR domain-containing protein [Methylopila sp. 73B]|uniref:FecR family protein n=1 Tax=Methylopila sp. 73B TaxID=1120792 RepID=UPI00036EA42C|nr:FecR domain-containing protein [Methylopila sp. 73B]